MEKSGVSEEGPQVVVPLVQAPQDFEDKGPIGYYLAKVAEGIGHALRLVALVIDEQITLDEDPKGNIKMKGACLLVARELLLDGRLCLACCSHTFANDVRGRHCPSSSKRE